jgi:hypothetical protein
MNTKHKHYRKPGLYLWLETGAFFFFSVAISSLTIMGGLGINPFDSNNALSNTATEVR